MITLHKLPDFQAVEDMKRRYLESLSAPLDGMWEMGFINPQPHWQIRVDEALAGYFVSNDEQTLLQFYVRPEFDHQSSRIFQQVLVQNNLKYAMVGTIDPLLLRHCLDVQRSVKVHTHLYEAGNAHSYAQTLSAAPQLRAVTLDELDRVIQFQTDCLTLDRSTVGWLRVYSSALIERSELFVLPDEDRWLGLGELRRSDTQTGVADVGMMVAPAHRGRGLATSILARLRAACESESLRAICSTTAENVAAQKAILKAGFRSRHRIIRVEL